MTAAAKRIDENKQSAAPSDSEISLTFAKGLNVLKAFDSAELEEDLTIAEIARRTGFDRAVTRRLVLTLERFGYVRRRRRGFRLTPKILLLAGGFLQSRQLIKNVAPVLNEFSRELGAPIYLAVRDGYDVIYLAHAALESRAISIGFTVGSRVPLLATSIGRALAAFAPPEEIDDLIANAPLKAYTDRTTTDRQALRERLEQVRELGYAYVNGEFEAGVAAAAVPTRSDANFPTAIGVSFDHNALDDVFLQKATQTLRDCRNSLSGALTL